VTYLHLFARFVVISLVAFGGGQAALPLVERVTVQDTGWLSASTFGTAVAFSYLTPGPVLIVATFIGFHVASSALSPPHLGPSSPPPRWPVSPPNR
jgi:chromate transporter